MSESPPHGLTFLHTPTRPCSCPAAVATVAVFQPGATCPARQPRVTLQGCHKLSCSLKNPAPRGYRERRESPSKFPSTFLQPQQFQKTEKSDMPRSPLEAGFGVLYRKHSHMYVGVLTVFMAKLQSVRPLVITVRFGTWCGRRTGGELGGILFERGSRAILVLLFGNTEGCCPKLPSCWSALRPWRAEERKVGGKAPVTSFLRPHWGLRRGRARFLWKCQAGAGGARRSTSPGRRLREAPSLRPSSRETSPGPPAAQAVLSPAANEQRLGRSPGLRQRPPSSLPAAPAASPPARLSPGPDGF